MVTKSREISVPQVLVVTKPTSAGGTSATFFNEWIQTDLVDLWGRTYATWVSYTNWWTLLEHLLKPWEAFGPCFWVLFSATVF